MTGFEGLKGCRAVVFALCAAVVLVLGAAVAGAEATVAVDLNVPSNVGDVAEVGLMLDYAGVAPTVMILYLSFDNMRLEPVQDYYETIPVDAHGNPVRDADGNVQAVQSAVSPAASISGAGKTVEVEYYDAFDDNVGRGGVGIAIAGLNTQPLPKGEILRVALRVLSNNQSNAVVPVYGVDAQHPVIIGGHVVSSSASSASGSAIALTVSNGSVALGCDRPAAPTGVTASQNQNNIVNVVWTGGAGLEYRVFRSTGSDPLAAQALGDGWTTETSFEDVTAAAPTVVSPPGCFKKGVYEITPYYYWVKSRNLDTGCESDASTPAAQGWRTESKALVTIVAAASPSADPGAWLVLAAVLAVLALHSRRALRHR